MNKNKMKYLLIILLPIILWNCSSSTETTKESAKEKAEISKKDKDQAKEYVISASLNEMKGNYSDAIIDYQEALRLDPSPGIHYSLGKNYLRIQKMAPALIHAKAAVKADSTNSDYNYLLASVYQLANERDSAVIVFNRIIENDSTDERAYYSLAKLYQSDKPLKALELYHKLLDLVGPQWNVLVEIADLNERMGNVEETIKTIEDLTEVDPSNLRIKKLLIESYLKTQKYDKALKATEELLVQYPDDINLLEYHANALIQSGNWEQGSKEYKELIKRKDLPLQTKIKIGGAFFAKSAEDSTAIYDAKEIFQHIDSDTTQWQVKLYLAQIALEEDQDSTAADYFFEAADLAPWNPQIFMSLGGLLFDSGRYQEAVDIIEPAVQRFPDEFVLNVIVGLSYTQMLEYKKAEPYLKKSLLLNPNDFTALYAYGVTLNQLDKSDDALIYLKKALEQEPENVPLLGTIGLIHENLGEYSKSEEIYEKALELNPENALVLNNYAYALAERNKQLDRALEMVTKAVEFDSTNSSYLDTMGWVYYKLNDYGKAKYYIEKSLEKDPENAEVLDHLGDVYYKLNNIEKAVGYWQKAFELDPDREGLAEKIEKEKL